MAVPFTWLPIQTRATIGRGSGTRNGAYEVYVGTTSLRATPGPGQWVMSIAYDMGLREFRHYFTLLKPSREGGPCLVFDFQPLDPENLSVAFAVLSGCSIPGIVLERELSRLPTKGCWLVGKTPQVIGIGKVREFNKCWDTNLRLGEHDCRQYANALVEHLTGEKNIVGRLENTSTG